MVLSIIVALVLIASIIYSLYKKNYNSAIGIGIMLVVYLILKNRIGLS